MGRLHPVDKKAYFKGVPPLGPQLKPGNRASELKAPSDPNKTSAGRGLFVAGSFVRLARHSPRIAPTSLTSFQNTDSIEAHFLADCEGVGWFGVAASTKDRAFISLQKDTPPRDLLPAYNASP